MQNWRNPWWIALSGIFPVGALLALIGQIFYIIEPLLNPAQKNSWYALGGSLGILCMGQLAYFLYLRMRNKKSSLGYTLLISMLYGAWLYSYVASAENLMPIDTPTWMVPNDAFLYPFGLIMPTLAFSLYSLIGYWTNFEKNPNPWTNLAGAVSIPVAIYLAVNLIFINRDFYFFRYFEHLGVVVLVGFTILFLFLLGRSAFILAHRNSLSWARWQILIKGLLGIVFPIWGLMLNNGDINHHIDNIFGDFSGPWFYGLAVVNGILFCLPNYPQPWYRLALFIARSLCIPFIVYFGLVFLPFLPMALPAILFLGAGFLMLTPVILIILQASTWVDDLNYLRQIFTFPRVLGMGIASWLVLPTFLYFNCLQDRNALHQALDYVYAPNLSTTEKIQISNKRLARVFTTIRLNKKRGSWEPGSTTMPYLSHFYNSIVLDNLTISDRKLDKLEAIFLGEALEYFPEAIQRNSVSKISSATVDSRWNEIDQSWLSTVALEIENPSETLSEYRSIFELPDGALIQDYYLYIGKEKVNGELAEKKTATWIYEQIVNNSRRDPGLLSYLDARTLSLRVYPFLAKEVRKTGFTVIHKEAFHLQLDRAHELTLGDISKNSTMTSPIILNQGKLAYIPAAVEENLPLVDLPPHYHFIVDCSAQSAKKIEALIAKIELLIRSRKYPLETLHFHLTNHRVITLSDNTNWQAAIRKHVKQGGFFAERAFEQILYHYASKPLQHYPVMVLVGGDRLPIMPGFAPHLAHTVYNGMRYYYLGDDFLETSGFLDRSELVEISQTPIQARAYPNAENPIAYLSSSSLIHLPGYQPSDDLKKGSWESATSLQAEWQYQEMHPELGDKAWLSLIKKSFETGLLTPETAYLVLENEAQRRMLRVKQQQALQGKKALDVGEDPVRMSEPGFWLLLGLLLLAIGFQRNTLLLVKKL
ncbi:MAG TPA: MSEP-CTERM sorting domain-containing protein [Haliscomenobacter sp.]|uniref:MSEP-CTERM sorting domain-containing protein n=1 Tax=Haliscomenobacter sp. TaxID=2717303 RepID=UPI002CFF56F1|nr:MSEP-CTERM sorting domain-containing protein [Haliscomenobacter sp.]HOY18482.1 MSEP-CTERM sorting domain-containing protein [Haliscomenobacter sp.]